MNSSAFRQMKAMLVALTLASTLAMPVAHADVVLEWNEAALNAIRAQNTSPPAAARNLAILHGAIYDAVNGIHRTHDEYLVKARAPASASSEAAATAAAHTVLMALYPIEEPSFAAISADILGRIPAGRSKEKGLDWGQRVAERILAARANDGSTAIVLWPGSDEPGQWRPTVSFGGVVRPALLPAWGEVKPFALENAAKFLPPPPPALDSSDYAAELNAVQAIGAIGSTSRTVEQTEIAQFWAYGPGTATPPGHWNEIAQSVAVGQGNSFTQNARMFALLNIALADAAIVSWYCKYLYNYWRPITAIQLADTDGNPDTTADPGWMSLLDSPPFPEYTSGHSTFSGAAAKALALFFKTDRISFSAGSDDLPGVYRFYDSFSEAAQESGLSRIYGGIHFQSGNVYGLKNGAQTGKYVVRNYLRPKSRHRHK